MQWRRGVDLVLSVYGRGPALPLQEPSKLIFLPLCKIHSRQEISKSPYYLHSAILCYTIQLAVFNMSTYDGSDVDIIFAGGGTAAC
jgi:hypothetical protein